MFWDWMNAQADARRGSERMNCLKAANVGNAGDQRRPSNRQSISPASAGNDREKGDVVTWSSQAAGSWKTKTGVITEVWEYKKQTRYTVKVDPKEGSTAKPKFYYPRTSALQKVP